VLLEAQQYGTPVAATRVGGVPEAVREGETALLADAGDAEMLVDHCRALLADASLRRRMGEAGRAFVTAAFTAEKLGESHLRLLDLPGTCKPGRDEGEAVMEAGRANYPLTDLEPQLRLVEYLRRQTAEALCLLAEDSIQDLLPRLPGNCLCVAAPPDAAYKEHVRPGMIACLLAKRTPSPALRKMLFRLGVAEMIVSEDGALYRLPTRTPSLARRIKNMAGLL
jgi:hypothetical protein